MKCSHILTLNVHVNDGDGVPVAAHCCMTRWPCVTVTLLGPLYRTGAPETRGVNNQVSSFKIVLYTYYRIVVNKRSCLNKRAPITGWNIPLKIGQNWSKMSQNGRKTTIIFI